MYLFFTAVSQVYAFFEGFVTNVQDSLKCARWKIVVPLFLVSLPLAAIFTSNFGWFFLDATETYVARYVVPAVGLLQCIAVGWVFEYDTTANASRKHAKSLRVLSVMFWVPAFLVCLYCNLSTETGNKFFGLLAILIWTWVSLFCSFKAFDDNSNSWYHEIVLCGVDKVAMGVTSLSYKNH